MNLTLLDSMIHPLAGGRQQTPSVQCDNEEQHCKGSFSGPGQSRRLPTSNGQPPKSLYPSKSIPICNITRTLSELQLHEDEALADYRDFCFYSRLVNGISSRQEITEGNYCYHRPSDQSLANIIRTRNRPVTTEVYSSSDLSAGSCNTRDPEVKTRHQSFLGGSSTQLLDEDQEEIFILDMWWINHTQPFLPIMLQYFAR